ncbi:hypothetical protein KFL_003660090 [Klebsormidium nitens]|uniref:Uncharacterized protein n=1 Tax=Klebsormidium nitens TaxID=105231 RepID=A0A1Y1IDX3_KLENI|nr:hypothetical protein KFL_003660090 [Klebsormidium nitens]|eukprot:GAQ87629.1 hypothetical protein KFL_003660090 [Klebsormidium nitens]
MVLDDVTWKELCLMYAGGLVEELGYCHQGAGDPPGGWRGLFKLLVHCPGVHFPTFEPVLQSETLKAKYDWTYGRGHVQSELREYRKGVESKKALFLSVEDEIVVSRLCCHFDAACKRGLLRQYNPPPIFCCRGVVKNFRSSGLAEVTGAATFLTEKNEVEADKIMRVSAATSKFSQENVAGKACDGSQSGLKEGAKSQRGSSGEETKAEVSSPRNAGPCPYCGGQTFHLPSIVFPGAYAAESYDVMTSDVVNDFHVEGFVWKGRFLLITGFVCLAGHLVLGVAGHPNFGRGLAVPHSGDRLQLQPAEAVAFMVRFMAGEQGLAREEGQRYISSLELETVMAVEARLTQLKEIWPLDKGRLLSYKVFEDLMYPHRYSVGSIMKVLRSNVPADLLEIVGAFVGTGSMTAAECKRSILEAFETHEREEKQKMSRAVGTAEASERCVMPASTPPSSGPSG